jgi:hypothetical protein
MYNFGIHFLALFSFKNLSKSWSKGAKSKWETARVLFSFKNLSKSWSLLYPLYVRAVDDQGPTVWAQRQAFPVRDASRSVVGATRQTPTRRRAPPLYAIGSPPAHCPCPDPCVGAGRDPSPRHDRIYKATSPCAREHALSPVPEPPPLPLEVAQ